MFFPQAGVLPEALPIGKISPHCYISRLPQSGAIVHPEYFQLTSTYRDNAYISQAQPFVIWSWGIPPLHVAIDVNWKSSSSAIVVGDRGLATCLCSLLWPSSPAYAQFYAYHFHLMKCCWWTHPILWLGSDRTQVIIGIFGYMITWSTSFQLGLSSTTGAIFSKIPFQKAWPCSSMVGVYVWLPIAACHKQHVASFPITDAFNTIGCLVDQATGTFAPQSGPAAESSCSRPHYLLCHPIYESEQYSQVGNKLSVDLEDVTQALCPLLVARCVRHKIFPLLWRKCPSIVQTTESLKTSLNICRVYVKHLRMFILSRPPVDLLFLAHPVQLPWCHQ